jgi:hypothetical protein
MGSDLTIAYKVTTSGVMGQAARTGTSTEYMNANHIRVNDATTSIDTLIDLDAQMMYVIDNNKKLIKKASFQEIQQAMAQLDTQSNGQMAAMMNQMFGDPSDVQVDKTGPDTVAGRACTKYHVRVGKMNQDMSIDSTLKPPMDMVTARKMMGAMVPGPVGKSFRALYEQMVKIGGMPLKTHMIMDAGMVKMESTREATSISQSAIAAGTWGLPSGYQTESLLKDLQKGMSRR